VEKRSASENGGTQARWGVEEGAVPFLFHSVSGRRAWFHARGRGGVRCETDIRTHSRVSARITVQQKETRVSFDCCKTTSCESILVVRKLGCGLWVRYLAVPSSCIARSAVPCTMLMMSTQIILRSTLLGYGSVARRHAYLAGCPFRRSPCLPGSNTH
jgi:hypothetical protein